MNVEKWILRSMMLTFLAIGLMPFVAYALDFYPSGNIQMEEDWNILQTDVIETRDFNCDGCINPEDVNDIDKDDIEGDINTFVDVAGDSMSGTLDMVNNDIINVGDLNASDVNLGGLRIPQLFTKITEPTGFLDRTSSSLGFVDATRVFTITGTGFPVYVNGVEYLKNTESITVADTTGTHWIYYAADGTLSQATTAPLFSLPLIATIYYNTDGGFDKGTLGEERHGIKMDVDTHSLLHYTVGTRYESGLTGTFGNTTFDITSGVINDEDIAHQIGAETTCKVFYKDGAADFKWTIEQAAYYHEVGGVLQYNNGNALANVTAANHVAYWIFATNDTTTPIYSLMGQRQDVTLANARINNTYESLTLGTLPFQEMKILYRVILKNVGGTTTYVETQDLRSVSNLPAGTYVATQHNVLSGLNWSQAGHTFDEDLNLGAYGLKAFGDANLANVGVSGNTFLTSLYGTGDINFETGTSKLTWNPTLASFGVGRNAVATGNRSFATGYNTDASGDQSFAAGYDTTANNNQAFAAGSGTTASGAYSTAFGINSTAGGDQSFAAGYSNDAGGASSISMGYDCQADGGASLCLGTFGQAIGASSISAGDRTRATGSGAFAFGFTEEIVGTTRQILAEGEGSIAGGYAPDTGTTPTRIYALGDGSIAMGYSDINLVANGTGAIALGYNVQALGEATVSLGKDITCEKDNQTCVHDLNAVGDTNLASLEADNAYLANLTCTVDANFLNLEANNFYGDGSGLTNITDTTCTTHSQFLSGTDVCVDINNSLAAQHVSSTGASHSYLNQAVTIGADVGFGDVTLIGDLILKYFGQTRYLIIRPDQIVTADRMLTLRLDNANRKLTLSGDATLNQNVTTAASPTFAGVITPAINSNTAQDLKLWEDLNIDNENPGRALWVYRNAPEGKDYVKMWVDEARQPSIDGTRTWYFYIGGIWKYAIGSAISIARHDLQVREDLNVWGDTNLSSVEANNAYFGNITATGQVTADGNITAKRDVNVAYDLYVGGTQYGGSPQIYGDLDNPNKVFARNIDTEVDTYCNKIEGIWSCDTPDVNILAKLESRDQLKKDNMIKEACLNKGAGWEFLDKGCILNEETECLSRSSATYWDGSCKTNLYLDCDQTLKTWNYATSKCEADPAKECKEQQDMNWKDGKCVFSQEKQNRRLAQECDQDTSKYWNGSQCVSASVLSIGG